MPPATMSLRQLRKCYGRAMLCCAVLIVLTQLLSVLFSYLYYFVLEPILYFSGVSIPEDVALIVLNDIVSYVPVLLAIPLTVGRNPDAPPHGVRPMPRPELLRAIGFCVGVLYLSAYATDFLIALLEAVTGTETGNTLDALSELSMPVYVVATVVVAPVCEEFLFRKLYLNHCRILGDTSAVLLSAAAFALMHENLYQTFYAFAVGLCLGCVALLTGRIRECILIHACVNGVSCLAVASEDILWQAVLFTLIVGCIGYAVLLFLKRWRGYHFDPGPLPFTAEEKRHACLTSPCFWICGGGCLVVSVVRIFLE